MTRNATDAFSTDEFLATEGPGRRVVHLRPRAVLFAQGSLANCVFYVQTGRARLAVVSQEGKEATIALLAAGEFVGEESLASSDGRRVSTATAITTCSILRIDRDEMTRVIHEERSFNDLFLHFLLRRSIRTQADLVDQLFNSSEKRLARTLLLMAEAGTPGEYEGLIPEVTQETLAEIIGTTRSRVSFFMNRFRRLGLLDYNGRIHVQKELLSVFLQDRLPALKAAPLPEVVLATPKQTSPKSTPSKASRRKR